MTKLFSTLVLCLVVPCMWLHGQTNTIQLRHGSNSTTILPSSTTTVTVQIPSLSTGTHYLLTSTSNPGSAGAAGAFLTYGATSAQNTLDISATNYLFNVGYGATVVEQNALGGLITAAATGTNMNATALTLSATGTGTGTSDALYISNGRLKFKESNGNFVTTFQAGDQAANINYTLPTADGTSGAILTTNGSGVLSWSTTPSAFSIDNLSDAKYGGTGFDYSMILGHQTTGAISGADAATLNTATGYDALKKITTGDQNTAYGAYSLQETTSGTGNTAIGAYAGWEHSTAQSNTFVGMQAGMTMKTGSNNVGIGNSVMRNASPGGSHNTAIGNESMLGIASGTDNVAVGSYALHNADAGVRNIAMGRDAGLSVSSGSNNVLIGYEAGDDLTTGSGNVFIGYQVGSNNSLDTEGDLLLIDNSSTTTPLIQGDFSANTLTFNGSITTTGTTALNGNVTVGGGASASEVRFLEPSGSGSDYTAFKAQAQAANVTYTLPAADGTNGQALITNGSGSLSWGAAGATTLDGLSDAKVEGTDFTGSMILGHQATGTLSAATYNTAVGIGAMDEITQGDYNTALGSSALTKVTTGNYNIAVGSDALVKVNTGSYNVSLGSSAGREITTGTYNVSVGHQAGNGITTGVDNIAIGFGAFYFTTTGSKTSVSVATQ